MEAVLDSPAVKGQTIDVGKIKELRLAAGLTMARASEAAGIPGGAPAWADIESGRRGGMKFGTLLAVSDAIGCDVRDLITPPKRKSPK